MSTPEFCLAETVTQEAVEIRSMAAHAFDPPQRAARVPVVLPHRAVQRREIGHRRSTSYMYDYEYSSDYGYQEVYNNRQTFIATVNGLKRKHTRLKIVFIFVTIFFVLMIGAYLLVMHLYVLPRNKPIISECMPCKELKRYCLNKDASVIKDLRVDGRNECCIRDLMDILKLIHECSNTGSS